MSQSAFQKIASWWLLSLIVIGAGLLLATPVTAAEPTADEEEIEIPEPEVISLTTDDKLDLKATFYGGTLGKKSVPIVILHDYKGNRNEFHKLAMGLQSLGQAVLVPDLRGHGDSTKFKAIGPRRPAEITAARMRRASDFAPIVLGDLEAVRRFLLDKNNAGELNLNKLTVIGAGGMGSSMAMNWALRDWSFPPLATGKQGQDIKALVLLSPEWSFKGVTIDRALAHPAVRSQVAMLILVGAANPGAVEEAERIYNRLEPFHPTPPPDRAQERDLFLLELETNLQGSKLITVPGLNVPATIAQFVDLRLVNADFPWLER